MADYLTRLVERTLGLSPTVRPEIPPAFAPETGDPPPPEPAAEPVPDTGPGGYSPPTDNRSARRAGNPSQRPEQIRHPEPPEEGAPLVQHDGSNPVERGDVPPSTVSGPFGTENVEERTVIEHHPTEAEREGDEILRGPEGHRQSPARRPLGAAASHEATGRARREPEESGVVPDRPGVPASEPPTGPPETIRDDEPPTGPSETSARPAKRPGGRAFSTTRDRPATAREETDVTAPDARRRKAEPSSARAHTDPAAEAIDPDRQARPSREWSVTQDRSVLQAAGREEHDRISDPSAGRPGPVVASHQRREATKVTSSPTVRITIGRVEVRAIPPEPVPVQPPTEVRSEPALSLEDYLKQHSGGWR